MRTNNNPTPIPAMTRFLLRPVPEYFRQCSGETRRAFRNLSSALLFTILVCTSILAASFCQFGMRGDYRYFPLFFLLAAGLYYLVDKPIVFSAASGNPAIRRWRFGVAIIFGLLNSFLIDSFFFAPDIDAARKNDIALEEKGLRDSHYSADSILRMDRARFMHETDELNNRLSAKRDSLNAEADGSGGSRKRGTDLVWQSKYTNYRADSLAVSTQIEAKNASIRSIDSTRVAMAADLESALASVPGRHSLGVNKNMQLLERVVFSEGGFTNILMALIWLIVTMIMELIPLISKYFYDTDEYFKIAWSDKQNKDSERSLSQNKELQLAGRRVVNDFKLEEYRLTRSFQEEKMEDLLYYNKSINETAIDELERLRKLDDLLKKEYPAYYVSHVQPMIQQSHLNLHKAISEALAI